MSLQAVTGVPFEAVLSPYTTGREADLTVEVFDPTDGAVLVAATGTGIEETKAETYRIIVTLTTAGTGRIVRWRDTTDGAPGDVVGEDMVDVLPAPGTAGIFAEASWDPPTIDELAALMFARATGEYGQTQTFTAESRPTATQATIKISQAFSMVAPRVGFVLDERFHESARFLATLYAALLLEPGYWPEDQQGNRAAWEQWKLLYDEGMIALLQAIADGAGGDDTGPDDDLIDPVWFFGPVCDDHVPGAELPHEPVSCRRHRW